MDRGDLGRYGKQGKVRQILTENRRAAQREQNGNRQEVPRANRGVEMPRMVPRDDAPRQVQVQREEIPRRERIQREEVPTQVPRVQAPRQGRREELRRSVAMENVVQFATDSPPVPAVARRLNQQRQQQIEMVPLNQPVIPPLPSPSVHDGAGAHMIIRIPLEPVLRQRTPPQQAPPNNMVLAVEGPFMEWSLLQVWNNLAYATCSVPYRVSWNEHLGKFVMKHCRLQQLCFALQNGAAVVQTASRWHALKVTLDGPANPLKYIRITGIGLKVLNRFVQLYTTVFGMKHVLNLHNFAQEYDISTGNYQIKMGKGMTILFLVIYSAYLFGYSSMSAAIFAFVDQSGWDWGLADIIQIFGCYSRQKYIWTNVDDCPAPYLYLSDIPLAEYLLGGLEICTYVSGVLVQEHSMLQIMTSCLTLLEMSWTLLEATDNARPPAIAIANGNVADEEMHGHQRPNFHFLEESAGMLSSFIGLLLVFNLIDVAFDLPKCLDAMFNLHSIRVVMPAIHIILFFAAFFVACVSALQISEVQDQITEPHNDNRLPQEIARLIMYLLRVFKKAVGIGYRNVFVLNFPFLFLYCCSVASLVAFTYETENDEKQRMSRSFRMLY